MDVDYKKWETNAITQREVSLQEMGYNHGIAMQEEGRLTYSHQAVENRKTREHESMMGAFDKILDAQLDVWVFKQKTKIAGPMTPKQEEIETMFKDKWKFWDK